MDNQIREAFVTFLRHEKGLRETSITTYLKYMGYLSSENQGDLLKLTKYQDVANLITSIKIRRNWSERTAYKVASMACKFYNWAARAQFIEESPMRLGHEFKRTETKQIDFFDWESTDFKRFCNNPYFSVRTRTIVHILRSSGIRASELCDLKKTDVIPHFKQGWIKIVCGKGGRDRFAPIDDEAQRWLDIYLNDLTYHGSDQEHLFLTEGRRKKLNAHDLYMLLSQSGKKMGLKVNPHKFRHSLAGQLISNGADITLAAEVLGHTTLSSTKIYTHFKKDQVKQMYDKFITPFSIAK